MTCNGCEISVVNAACIFSSREKCIKFLQNHGVIFESVKCTTCGEAASLNESTLYWRCQRRHKKKSGKRIVVSRCNFKQTLRSNTWLRSAHLSLEKSCMLIALYITHNPPHQQFLMDEFKMSSETVSDWCSFAREVFEHWCIHNSASELGGPGKIVEIDEAKFGKRKYNRGRIVDGVWLFGGFERDSKNILMETVPNRNSDTLLKVIKRRIRPETTIMSDCWKAYNCLQDEGYKHLVVNHTYNFVDPDTKAYTQNIERTWRDAHSIIPKYGRRDYHMSGYIAEFLFRKHFHNHTEHIHAFFSAINLFFMETDP